MTTSQFNVRSAISTSFGTGSHLAGSPDSGSDDDQTWVLVLAVAGWLVMAAIAVLLVTGVWSPADSSSEPVRSPELHTDRPSGQAISRRAAVPQPRIPESPTPASAAPASAAPASAAPESAAPRPRGPQPQAPRPRLPRTGS